MTKVDQFESTFKAAAKPVFKYEAPVVKQVLVLTDLPREEADAFGTRTRVFMQVLDERADDEIEWTVLDETAFSSVAEMLTCVRKHDADLICTYRSLHSDAWRYTTTVGRYLDVLAQETDTPVLVVPSPRAEVEAPEIFEGALRFCDGGTCTVMAMTDHLTGDHHLVSMAAFLTRPRGRLFLTHVEDDEVFERYVDAISKIPSIDTDNARETILKQLLKEPHDFVRSCAGKLREGGLDITIEELISMGHHLKTYQQIVEEHEVDLLVLNTKDEDQFAMHGRAYPLTVQLRHMPLLLV